VDFNFTDLFLTLITSIGALYFLAPGAVGYYQAPLNLVERALLVILALVMIVDPLDAASVSSFVTGAIPLIVGFALLLRNRRVAARTMAATTS
jgi:hypothetical protein